MLRPFLTLGGEKLAQLETFEIQAGLIKAVKNKEMWIEGIASTASRDEDGEIVIPQGLDFSYAKKFGKFVWEHRTKDHPKFIVGAPKEITRTDKEVRVAGPLFKGNEISETIWKMMVENPEEKIWGFSLEGTVDKRDPDDPSKIIKATVRNFAITSNPVNTETFVTWVKSVWGKALTGGTETTIPNIRGGQSLTEQSIDKEPKTTTWDSEFIKNAYIALLRHSRKYGGVLTRKQVLKFLIGYGLTKEEADRVLKYIIEKGGIKT